MIDARPAAVRLTELAEGGWPTPYLATRLCVNPHTVAKVRDGMHAHISIAIDQRILHLHAELLRLDPVAAGLRPGDVARARTWAARRAGRARLPRPRNSGESPGDRVVGPRPSSTRRNAACA
jgi:hypothetical protein